MSRWVRRGQVGVCSALARGTERPRLLPWLWFVYTVLLSLCGGGMLSVDSSERMKEGYIIYS